MKSFSKDGNGDAKTLLAILSAKQAEEDVSLGISPPPIAVRIVCVCLTTIYSLLSGWQRPWRSGSTCFKCTLSVSAW